jgi:hypothetical protein
VTTDNLARFARLSEQAKGTTCREADWHDGRPETEEV